MSKNEAFGQFLGEVACPVWAKFFPIVSSFKFCLI